MELATLPQVAEPAGFNFAEVRAADTAALETLLGQLGFASNGRHRTKNVQLWTMGHARVIINEEPAGAATASAASAPAIAALGFDVASPVIAAARAQQLKAPAVPRKSQADEEIFQGFAAPDSTEIFLCQGNPDGTAAWTREFGEGLDVPAPDRPGDPGAVIDHVNLAQPWQHFDEAVLFYTSALALEPQPFAEVASPTGLVRSQVMLTRDRGVRLVLNLAPLIQQEGAAPGAAGTASTGHRRATRNTSPSRWMTSWRRPAPRRPGGWTSCASRKTTTRTSMRGSRWSRRSWPRSGSSTCSTTATPTANSCTSTPPPSAACSSKWWNAAAPTTATAPPTPRSGTPSSTTTCTS